MELLTENASLLVQGLLATLYMTLFSVLFSYILGMPLGILLVTSSRDGIRPMPVFHAILGWIINVGRSIPFIILIVALIPFTRWVVGTSLGQNAAVVALVVAAAPFVARMVETSLKELEIGVVEAARTMGATDWQIITKVLVPEAVPSLIRGSSITTITIIGYSAIAGAVGAGGLGDIAIRYGYHRYETGLMWVTIIMLIIVVQIIQVLLSLISRAVDKRNR
ncbi:MAG: methionine ABC transporter permease [Christensenellales bacterium]